MTADGHAGAWEHPLELRWRDLDHLGHVYHGAMVELLDEARAAWMAFLFPAFSGEEYVLARQELDYLAELCYEDGPVVVRVEIERVGTKSVTVQEAMRNRHGAVVVHARSTIVMWEVDAHRSRPLDAGERAALEARAPARALADPDTPDPSLT